MKSKAKQPYCANCAHLIKVFSKTDDYENGKRRPIPIFRWVCVKNCWLWDRKPTFVRLDNGEVRSCCESHLFKRDLVKQQEPIQIVDNENIKR